VKMKTFNERLALIEKEVAELKRQLENRPISESFSGEDFVVNCFLEGIQRNVGGLQQLLKSAGEQSALTSPEKPE